jgi:3',5'-cyclic AMP phosphodiesterase CpdA
MAVVGFPHRLPPRLRALRPPPAATVATIAVPSMSRHPAPARRIVHVSDVHFGSPGVTERSVPLLAAISDLEPSVVAVSGDLTRRAHPEQFREARRFLDALPSPYVVVPGNHDVPFAPWLRFHRRHSRFLAHVADEAAPCFVDDHLAISGMDTTRGFAIDGGRARKHALAVLEERFAALPRRMFRVVVAHHPFTKQPGRRSSLAVQKARRALGAFDRLGVDAVLTGHRHETVVVPVTDVARDVERPFLLVQAGTATTYRGRCTERGRNSFVTLDVGRDEVVVVRHVYDPAEDAFVAERPQRFPRLPGPDAA